MKLLVVKTMEAIVEKAIVLAGSTVELKSEFVKLALQVKLSRTELVKEVQSLRAEIKKRDEVIVDRIVDRIEKSIAERFKVVNKRLDCIVRNANRSSGSSTVGTVRRSRSRSLPRRR